MPRRKRKSHYLMVKYPDGEAVRDLIRSVEEDGMRVGTGYQERIVTANWLDEHHCFIDTSKFKIPRPFKQHRKMIAARATNTRKGGSKS